MQLGIGVPRTAYIFMLTDDYLTFFICLARSSTFFRAFNFFFSGLILPTGDARPESFSLMISFIFILYLALDFLVAACYRILMRLYFNEFAKAGKIQLRTFMQGIKAVEVKLNGRISANHLLLKVQ